MKKFFIISISIALIAGMLLSGCNQQNGGTNSSGQSSSDSKTGGADVEKEKMLLTTLSGATSEQLAALVDGKIKEFNSKNKFNVEFEMETYEVEQYKTKLTTLMASNSQPDVFYTYEGGFLRPFVDGERIYPIGDLLDKDLEWKNRFVDGVFTPLIFNDKIYGVPMVKKMCVMFYNKKLFEEAGINNVPGTFEELKDAIETFKSMDIIPISLATQKAWIAGQFLQQLSNGIGGEELYNGICEGTVNWNDSRFIEAGEVFADLVEMDAFQPGFLGMSQDEGRDLFKNEKAAMLYAISSDFVPLTAEGVVVAENLDFFMLPPVNPENAEVNVGSIGNSFAMSSEVKNVEAAAALLKTFTDKDMQESLAYEGKQIIVTKQELDDTRLNPLAIKFINMTGNIHTLTPWFDRIFGAGEGTEFNNISVAIAGGKDPTEQMEQLQKFAEDNSTR